MKKTILTIFIVSLLNIAISAKTYYLSPTGSDSNTGELLSAPALTLAEIVNKVSPGDTILMRGGTYYYDSTVSITISGDSLNSIHLYAYEGEKPVLDFSKLDTTKYDRDYARGLYVTANYWHLKGLEICYSPDNGMKLEGSYDTIEQCVFHHNGDTGLQIGLKKNAENDGTLVAYNYVLNCDAYRNADPATNWENADGFACKLFPGVGNHFYGCRAWENVDDGWDLYETNYEVLIENCWTWRNGDPSIWGFTEFNGDGNGFKLGGQGEPGKNKVVNCVAFDCPYGAMSGFTSNNNGDVITLLNCTAWKCGRNFKLIDQPHILKNCLAFAPTTSDQYNGYTDSDAVLITNSWQLTDITVDSNDFVSISVNDAIADREADGSLPDNGFAKLKAGSDCIDKGTDVGLAYTGSAPDLGAYEYGATTSVYRISEDQKLVATRNVSKNSPVYYVNLIGSRVGKVMNYSVVNNKTVLTKLGSGVYYRVIPGTAAERVANVNKK